MAKSNQKYIILLVALVLAALGYYGYKSMLVSPDVNEITIPRTNYNPKTPNTNPNLPPTR